MAAAALQRIAVEQSGEPLSRARLGALLYYAQGLSLAKTGKPLFEEPLIATSFGIVLRELETVPDPWWYVVRSVDPAPLLDSRVLRDVMQVFGVLNAQSLASGVKVEAPWRTSREAGEISRTDIHDHFAEMLDDGQDVISELGLPSYSGRPDWEQPYRIAVNLKCLAGHPLFQAGESREMRRKLGLEDVPDERPSDAGEPGERKVAAGMW